MARRSGNVANFTTVWKDVLRLFPTNERVDDHNIVKLGSLWVPVAKVGATRKNLLGKSAGFECAQGLKQVIRLALGARVMLRINLWIERGLVNGALKTVMYILYDGGKRPPLQLWSSLIATLDHTGLAISYILWLLLRDISRSMDSCVAGLSSTYFGLGVNDQQIAETHLG